MAPMPDRMAVKKDVVIRLAGNVCIVSRPPDALREYEQSKDGGKVEVETLNRSLNCMIAAQHAHVNNGTHKTQHFFILKENLNII